MSKDKKVIPGQFKQERVVAFGNQTQRTKIDAAFWRRIVASPEVAREALVNLELPQGKVKEVKLANGNVVPVSEVTEKQAHEFMCLLAPDWAFND